jgi:hypothetical protein
MTRFTLSIIIIFPLLIGSCTSRKGKVDKKDLVPEKELVSIIKDVYLADGLLSIPKVCSQFLDMDSIAAYSSIIAKHGYTKEIMDKTLKYYFYTDPKRLIAVYDQVLGIFSQQESVFEKEALVAQRAHNSYWNGKDYYYLPGSSGNDSTLFNIRLNGQGVYFLTFTATLFTDDQSLNPGISAYTCHPDSTDSGKKRYFRKMNFIRDGLPHTYTLIIKVPVKTNLRVKGKLFDFDNNPQNVENHAILENISCTLTTPVI